MLPATVASHPNCRSRCVRNDAVVLLPLLPVTPVVVAKLSATHRSVPLVIGTPAAMAAATNGCRGLNPGDLKYSLEVLYQLLRARKMIEDLNERVIEDYRARHPRLAAEEMDAYEAARKAAAADKSKLPPGGAAGLMGLPVDSRLSDGFAIPIRVLLGTSRDFVRERGLLGTLDGTKEGVVLALSRPQTLVVSGQPGSGKTHVLLVIIEMLIQALRNISTLEKRAQVVWFHLGLSANDYPADLGPAQRPNSGPESVAALHALGGVPQGLPGRRVVFVPPGQPVEALQQRQREYPGAEIRIIRLGQKDRFPGYLRVLLGVEENPAVYLRMLDQLAADLGDKASPEALLKAIEEAGESDKGERLSKVRETGLGGERRKPLIVLDKMTKQRAIAAVMRAANWVAPEGKDSQSLWDGLDNAHVIVDMRSNQLTSRDALGVVMTLVGSLSQRRGADGDFLPAVAVLDEFNKLIAQGKISPVALSQLTEVRHRKTSTIISGQLPSQFPTEIANLATGLICGQIEGAESFEAICAMKPTAGKLGREVYAKLKKGEFICHFRDANRDEYRGEPFKVKIRPACAQPGGQTRSSIAEEEGED